MCKIKNKLKVDIHCCLIARRKVLEGNENTIAKRMVNNISINHMIT